MFAWVKVYSGVHGNEVAHRLEKEAKEITDAPVQNILPPFLKTKLKQEMLANVNKNRILVIRKYIFKIYCQKFLKAI